MNTFLNEVAQRLLQEHPESLDQVTVVFNNRRPGLFLRRQIEQIHGGTLFLPDIIGIDDLVHEMGKLELVPNEFLLFELFAIHRQLGGDQRKYKTLEEFISFGDMMISDFSEIDLYHVDAEQLFTNLYDLKVIGEWNVSDSHLSPQQKEYLDLVETDLLKKMKDKDTRKLIFVNEELKLKFFLSKGPDVPTYVEYGAADIGVVGKDTILEEGRKMYEMLDFGIGKCKMCVAGPASAKDLLNSISENIIPKICECEKNPSSRNRTHG